MKNCIVRVAIGSLFFFCAFAATAQPSKHKTIDGPKKVPVDLKDVKSKEISVEFPCSATATVFLENIFRRVNILTSNDNKVRLVTSVYYQGDNAYTDADWLEKLDLNISGNAGNVVVKSGDVKRRMPSKTIADYPVSIRPDTIANGIAVFDSAGNWVNRKSSIRRNVVLYIPAGARLDIESKYADISLENNIKTIKLRLTNGSFSMHDAEQLIINGLYGNVHAGNIGNADIDMTNGSFAAKDVTTASFKSINSKIELNTVKQLTLASYNDNIDIEELGVVKGQKDYGDLRATVLKNSLDLTGKNADLKIRNIDPGVNLIKIDDQYADIRLPVNTLQNYTVNFEGTGGNLYASFEKKPLTATSFKATVGDANAKSTIFQLKCDNCTVDFK